MSEDTIHVMRKTRRKTGFFRASRARRKKPRWISSKSVS